ncbi:MAG: hypothetical protein ABJF10_17695 [Chthoniobacter sp.]|uniref:hypothetical protein n=1 Tax=Chthoniobacter sp. TaxID=2510640 RepID=UPI0032AC0290
MKVTSYIDPHVVALVLIVIPLVVMLAVVLGFNWLVASAALVGIPQGIILTRSLDMCRDRRSPALYLAANELAVGLVAGIVTVGIVGFRNLANALQ